MRAAALPYATLSVHSFVDKIGAYLGFAAIIGVALLVIMFFVQARETSRLRDRAEDAEEDLERLRVYAEQVGRQAASAQQAAAAQQAARPAQPPIRPASGVATVAAPAVARTANGGAAARPALPPVAPVGVGAPALSSATRLIPLPESGGWPSAPASAPVSAPAPAPAPSTAAAGAVVPAPPPAAAAPRSGAVPVVAPVPAPVLASTGAAPRAGQRSGASASSAPSDRAPRRDYGRGADTGSRIGKGSLSIAAVLVVVIIVAAVLIITHHSSGSKTARSAHVGSTTARSSTKGSKSTSSSTVRVNPNKVRVAVLNGTGTDNLAADVSSRLNRVGFQQGDTANYADQTQPSTTVGYLPDNRAQALAVAQALKVSPRDVQPVNKAAQQIVCPQGSSQCADQVVVTVGANLESDAS